jgi:hypothetical protein
MTTPLVGPRTIGVLFPEFQIVRGDLLATGIADGQENPETLYQSAYDFAGTLNARMSQLRAATRLARAWSDRGEGDRAVQALAPLYSSFDEGLATADLCDARDVLSEIAPGDFPPRGS